MSTVIVASGATNKAKRFTNVSARTWGELKTIIAELLSSNVEAILNPGNVTLNREDAVLPEGDYRVYLVPTKNKAGMTPSEAAQLGKDISNAIVEAAAKATTEQVEELKEELISVIEDFFDVTLNENDDACEECDEALEEVKALSRN